MVIRKATILDLKFLAELFDQYRVFYEKETNKEKAHFLKRSSSLVPKPYKSKPLKTKINVRKN